MSLLTFIIYVYLCTIPIIYSTLLRDYAFTKFSIRTSAVKHGVPKRVNTSIIYETIIHVLLRLSLLIDY